MRFYPFVFLPERKRTACDRRGANGNGASSRGTRRTDNERGQLESRRFLCWTEDEAAQSEIRASLLAFPSQSSVGAANRLYTVADERYYSYYAYDHTGQRTLKMTGDASSVDVNAWEQHTYGCLNHVTLYPSPYMVLTEQGYTKHYYAGTERVAARLGGGGLDALFPVIGNEEDLQINADLLFFKQSLEQVNSRVLHENDLDCIMSNEFAMGEFGHWIDGIPNQMKADVKFDHDQFKDMIHSMLEDLHDGKESAVYFYHSDHLGSAIWITDSAGVAVQHLQYLPFGERYISQRAAGSTYSERFTFTGKELDAETGYSYFGARYYDSDLSGLFLSVDPMADKYPSISPYAYCAWNPVKLVDPDGREWDKTKDKEQAQKMEEAVNNRIIDISTEIQSKRDKIEKLNNNAKMNPSKRDKKIAALNNELTDLEYQKGLLDDFVAGLHDLRDDPDKRYTFNPSVDAFQTNTFQEVNGVIPINYQEHYAIGMANLVHETTHAIQYYRNQLRNGNIMNCERNAYSTQYAYSSDSFKYINNNICPSTRISEAWVRGVYFFRGGKPFYPYMDIK